MRNRDTIQTDHQRLSLRPQSGINPWLMWIQLDQVVGKDQFCQLNPGNQASSCNRGSIRQPGHITPEVNWGRLKGKSVVTFLKVATGAWTSRLPGRSTSSAASSAATSSSSTSSSPKLQPAGTSVMSCRCRLFGQKGSILKSSSCLVKYWLSAMQICRERVQGEANEIKNFKSSKSTHSAEQPIPDRRGSRYGATLGGAKS